ncbi:MAG TPA: ABC transporter permease [Cyclobacteriaceae bacterium]|nr:ABC transporter permease [Cyclobacteriaceae bacterium]
MKRKVFSAINIFGLSIGFAVCLILLSFVEFELSYDRHNEKANQIYRTVSSFYIKGELRGTYPLSDFGQGPALLANIPEINSFVRTHLMHGGAVISNNDNLSKRVQFYEDGNIQYVDSNYFKMFTHETIEGNLQTALDQPNAIVLTENSARKYFGSEKQITGKVLNVSGSWWTNGDHIVTAVIKDPPSASHFKFDFLISMHSLLQSEFYRSSNGTSTEGNFVTYVELNEKASPKAVQDKLPPFLEKYQGEELKRVEGKATMILQPLTDIHLTPGYNLEMSPTIGMNTLYFFIAVSILVILLAWINYINLSTARATERGKEVGIKKAIGVQRYQLISQFMTESLILHLISGLFAIGFACLLLPFVGEVVNKALVLDFANPRIWIAFCCFAFVGSFIAAIYPSLILSSFKPITVLKGINDSQSRKFSLRHALVVFQFSISILITAGTFVVTRQLDFMLGQNKGFDSDKILVIKGPGSITDLEIENKVTSLKTQLVNLSMVRNVTTSEAIPGGGYNWGTGMRKDGVGVEENKSGEVVFVDPDFIDTYKMTLLSGSGWLNGMPQRQAVLLNEMALKTFGFNEKEDVIGEKLIIDSDTFDIAGVLEDYHWSSLKTPISSNVLASKKICGAYLSVQLQNADWNESITQIEKLYSAKFPEKPFEYFFLDDFFDRQYQEDRQFHKVVSLFALLSIIIASLGLWGMASFSISHRTKEISIRKVLGASLQSILFLLTSGLLKLIVIASIIALPITIYGINIWLDNFAYRINQSWDLYAIPIAILIFISTCTISATTVKAVLTNPADNLKAD